MTCSTCNRPVIFGPLCDACNDERRLEIPDEPTLTHHDWVEIAAALESKINALTIDEDTSATWCQRWIAHLEHILEVIGPYGTFMLNPTTTIYHGEG